MYQLRNLPRVKAEEDLFLPDLKRSDMLCQGKSH